MSRPLIFGVIAVAVLCALGVVAFIFVIVLGVFKLMDRTEAHVCGLASVRKSPIAARLLGTPVVQKGFTGGRSNYTNGELRERITFTVSGPLGEAFVVSEGYKSPLESHLTVRMGRGGSSETVYDGPFDCPELH